MSTIIGRLLLLRAEDFFADVPKAMARVQAHVGLPDAAAPMRRSSNRNTDPRKRASSAASTPGTLDQRHVLRFCRNEALYRWTASQAWIPWTRGT